MTGERHYTVEGGPSGLTCLALGALAGNVALLVTRTEGAVPSLLLTGGAAAFMLGAEIFNRRGPKPDADIDWHHTAQQ